MWYVIRYKKNSLNNLVVELKERLGCNLKVFTPLIKIPTVNKKLKKTRQENVLGNYTLMHHEKFSSSNFVQSLKFVIKLINSLKNIYLITNAPHFAKKYFTLNIHFI